MKKAFLWLTGGLLIVFSANTASAASFGSGNTVVVSQGQTINTNLYAAGGSLTISGDVNGDSFLAGGTIFSTGKVSRDLFAAGGNINISGETGNDLHAAGGSLAIGGKVNGEATVAGGQITLLPTATVSKDLYASGGLVVLNGIINGNVKIIAKNIQLNGTINGNANIRTNELTIGNNAVVKGTLAYSAPQETAVPTSAAISKVEFTKSANPIGRRVNAGPALAFFRFIIVLVVSLVLFAIFRKGVALVVQNTLTYFWKNLLTGFIAFIMIPVAAVIVAVTVVGLPISFLLGLTYAFGIVLSTVGVGAVMGTLLFALFMKTKDPKYQPSWGSIITGSVIWLLLNLIPIIGHLVSAVFFLAFFGQLFWIMLKGLKLAR